MNDFIASQFPLPRGGGASFRREIVAREAVIG
jgi:hypothetical protein